MYAAVDPARNEVLYTTLERTRTSVLADAFLDELREKHEVNTAVILIDGSLSLKDVCHHHVLDFKYEKHGNRNSVERVFRQIKRRTTSYSDCFNNAEADTADEWLRAFAFAWDQLI